jgi:hypothetical protein
MGLTIPGRLQASAVYYSTHSGTFSKAENEQALLPFLYPSNLTYSTTRILISAEIGKKRRKKILTMTGLEIAIPGLVFSGISAGAAVVSAYNSRNGNRHNQQLATPAAPSVLIPVILPVINLLSKFE